MLHTANPATPANFASNIPSPSRMSDQADRVLALDAATADVQRYNAMLSGLVASMRIHADSLFGCEPSTPETSNKIGQPSARLIGLSEAINTTPRIIAELEAQFARLAQL